MNVPTLIRTIFTDATTCEHSFGYRFYDDHGQTYCNTLERADLNLPDQEFLDKIKDQFDDVANSIFDFALEHTISIDGRFYRFNLEAEGGPMLISPSEKMASADDA